MRLTGTAWRDHPRSRGVYKEALAYLDEQGGSSPLARGLPPGVPGPEFRGWIIPARAGFTRSSTHVITGAEDHPRSRGVYAWGAPGMSGPVGSSPLARGLLVAEEGLGGEGRIIPARAGFTTTAIQQGGLVGDHPRSRGVYLTKRAGVEPRLGSSPLARGLHVILSATTEGGGIIPARAGFT